MRRREFVALIGGVVSAPLAFAQSPAKVHRLGILSVENQAQAESITRLVTDRLEELGWRSGQDVRIELRRTDAVAGLGELAAGLVASKPDILMGVGPYAAASLKDSTRTIPIVFVAAARPVERGLVSSLSRPGGNVTGVSHVVGVGLGGKSTELLKDLVPQAQRLALLINPDQPAWRTGGNLEKYLSYIGLQQKVSMIAIEARSGDELPAAFDAAVRARVDGLVVIPDSVLDSLNSRIVLLAAKHKLPAIHPYGFMVDAGGLMSYSTDMSAVIRRGADYVDRILKGAKPAEMPVEQPTKFELVINLKTAKALGLKFPQSVLLRADRVIE